MSYNIRQKKNTVRLTFEPSVDPFKEAIDAEWQTYLIESCLDLLDYRELAVMQLYASGSFITEIAEKMNLSKKTVERAYQKAIAKMNVAGTRIINEV